MTRYLVVICNGGSARIPDDEPETDHEKLIEKYFSQVECDIEHTYIEEY